MYEATGKEVLRNGKHFADTNDNASATLIARLLNEHDSYAGDMPELFDTQIGLPDSITWGLQRIDPEHMRQLADAPRHYQRREGDEYVCCCGVRWGVDEGDDHP